MEILSESLLGQHASQARLGGPLEDPLAHVNDERVVGVERLGDGAAPDPAEEDAADEVEEDLHGVVRLRVDGGVEGAPLHHDPVVDAQQGEAVDTDEEQQLRVQT